MTIRHLRCLRLERYWQRSSKKPRKPLSYARYGLRGESSESGVRAEQGRSHVRLGEQR